MNSTNINDISKGRLNTYVALLCGIFAAGWTGYLNDVISHRVLYPWGMLVLFFLNVDCLKQGWKAFKPKSNRQKFRIAMTQTWCACLAMVAVIQLSIMLWSKYTGTNPYHWMTFSLLSCYALIAFAIFFKIIARLFRFLSSWHSPAETIQNMKTWEPFFDEEKSKHQNDL